MFYIQLRQTTKADTTKSRESVFLLFACVLIVSPCIGWWSHERGRGNLEREKRVRVEGQDQFPGESRPQEVSPRHAGSGITEDDQDLGEAGEDDEEDGRDDLVADRVIEGDRLKHGGYPLSERSR